MLKEFWENLKNKKIYLVGIKGVGMTALAEILFKSGAQISGSDTSEVFFTDEILKRLGIIWNTGFKAQNIKPDLDLIIYSAAYSWDDNPELQKAKELRIECLSYPQSLGEFSRQFTSIGICGVHGKTTTTALAGFLAKALLLPATVLVGSEVPQFGNKATYIGGNSFFIAETCEYRRHFLFFQPKMIVLTSIEEDHQDYFSDLNDLISAFIEYLNKLPKGACAFYCADDQGAVTAIEKLKLARPDLKFIPYGFNAEGDFKLMNYKVKEDHTVFSLQKFSQEWKLKIPGKHTVLNAIAALALTFELAKQAGLQIGQKQINILTKALADFKGTRRRSEIIGQAGGILFMDDYAHHPTAIKTTLAGIREYYPQRRLVVDFMSHTYSRTKALFFDFAKSFTQADAVILHKIYASAREKDDENITGEKLFAEIKKNKNEVYYFKEPQEAIPFLTNFLKPNDLFVTMGAGDNWKIAHELYNNFKKTTY